VGSALGRIDGKVDGITNDGPGVRGAAPLLSNPGQEDDRGHAEGKDRDHRDGRQDPVEPAAAATVTRRLGPVTAVDVPRGNEVVARNGRWRPQRRGAAGH